MTSQEIVFEAAPAFAETRSEPRDRDQISCDGGEIEEAHKKADDSTGGALEPCDCRKVNPREGIQCKN
jgi:hypothetical protein